MTAPVTQPGETDLSTLQSSKIVDARGAACPGPLLEAKKSITGVPIGSVIEVWSSDPATKTDIGAWSKKVGHTYLGTIPADGYERTFVIREK